MADVMTVKFHVDDHTDPILGMQMGPGVLTNVHPPEQCQGEWCVIHNPSDHHMRDWPLNWRGDTGMMERFCEHGVGHPDPDDFAFHQRNGRAWVGVHGCDGCCTPPYVPKHRKDMEAV